MDNADTFTLHHMAERIAMHVRRITGRNIAKADAMHLATIGADWISTEAEAMAFAVDVATKPARPGPVWELSPNQTPRLSEGFDMVARLTAGSVQHLCQLAPGRLVQRAREHVMRCYRSNDEELWELCPDYSAAALIVEYGG